MLIPFPACAAQRQFSSPKMTNRSANLPVKHSPRPVITSWLRKLPRWQFPFVVPTPKLLTCFLQMLLCPESVVVNWPNRSQPCVPRSKFFTCQAIRRRRFFITASLTRPPSLFKSRLLRPPLLQKSVKSSTTPSRPCLVPPPTSKFLSAQVCSPRQSRTHFVLLLSGPST